MSHQLLQGDSCTGCREYEELTRQLHLSHSRLRIPSVAPKPWLPEIIVSDANTPTRDTLVVIFLRGAMDGLTVVAPFGDPNLYAPNLRPALAVPPPGEPNGAIDLDGFFGLAPAMAPLLPAYQNGDLLVVHATGSPDPTRSHFDAYQYMEYGVPLQPLTVFTGWLGRHLLATPAAAPGPLRGIAFNHITPRTLAGAPLTLPVPDPASFAFPGRPQTAADRQAALQSAFAAAGEPISSAGLNTIDTIDLLNTIDFDGYVPANGAVYPQSAFGNALRSTAALIKADVGVEVAMIELGGWDTHAQQTGPLQNLMTTLSGTLAAFHSDMLDRMNQLTAVAMSEFGRRADANGSSGTDHGHGNCMFAMGGGINGGQVIADWTDGALLHPDYLYEGDSLDVTIDYRDILAEILQNRLKNTDLANVFPNYSPTFHGVTI